MKPSRPRAHPSEVVAHYFFLWFSVCMFSSRRAASAIGTPSVEDGSLERLARARRARSAIWTTIERVIARVGRRLWFRSSLILRLVDGWIAREGRSLSCWSSSDWDMHLGK